MNGGASGEYFAYMYSYNQAGRVTKQRTVVRYGSEDPAPMTLDALYAWDNEGRMTSMTAPRGNGYDSPPVYNYQYDANGRPERDDRQRDGVGDIWCRGRDDKLQRRHADLQQFVQLTRIQAGTSLDIEYRYTAGQNNGRIYQQKDWITGEEVSYTYDSLNRLTKAETTDSAWGQAFAYDGFGNLTGKTVTKGSAPTLSQTFDPALNMPTGVGGAVGGADGVGRRQRCRGSEAVGDDSGGLAAITSGFTRTTRVGSGSGRRGR